MSRFHRRETRVDDDEFDGMDARRFFDLAARLPAYEGAVGARLMLIQEEAKKRSPSRAAIEQGAAEVDTKAAMTDPAIADWIEGVQVGT